jgi:hypothetical protein
VSDTILPLREHHLSAEQRRALELLTNSRNGANEGLLVLGRRMLAGFVRRGLAAAHREVVKAGGKTIEVSRVRITAARRRAIEG